MTKKKTPECMDVLELDVSICAGGDADGVCHYWCQLPKGHDGPHGAHELLDQWMWQQADDDGNIPTLQRQVKIQWEP